MLEFRVGWVILGLLLAVLFRPPGAVFWGPVVGTPLPGATRLPKPMIPGRPDSKPSSTASEMRRGRSSTWPGRVHDGKRG